MIARQKGFSLLIVLLILQVSTILVLTTMSMTQMQAKISNLYWHKFSNTQTLEVLLTKIEKDFQIMLPLCLIAKISTNDLIKKPLFWWQQQSCAGNFQSIQYYYVIELLNTDNCVYDKKTNRVLSYYRITLLGKSTHMNKLMGMQSTFARLEEASKGQCDAALHKMTRGRQSLRIISVDSY